MTISAIAAVGNQWQLGLNGGLPWGRHKEDMAWFREITAGKVMAVGWNTYRTIKRLEGSLGRSVSVIGRDVDLHRLQRIHDVMGAVDIVIVGGAATYKIMAPQITQLYLSRIDYDGPADTYFPVSAFSPEIIQNAIWRNE